jgi:hypothetical protein
VSHADVAARDIQRHQAAGQGFGDARRQIARVRELARNSLRDDLPTGQRAGPGP